MVQFVPITANDLHYKVLVTRSNITGRGLLGLVLFYCHQHGGRVTARCIHTWLHQQTGENVDYSEVHRTLDCLVVRYLLRVARYEHRTLDRRGRKSKPVKMWEITPQGSQILRCHRQYLTELITLLNTMS